MNKRSLCTVCEGRGTLLGFLPEDEANKECWDCKGSGIESKFTNNLVCPYCGHEEEDSWERADENSECQCEQCEKYFIYETDHTRTFTSSQADCLNDGEHKWREWVDYGPFFNRACRLCAKNENKPRESGIGL